MNYFRTILYFPSNNTLLVLIFVAWMLPEANAELVYDCTNQRNPVHAFSLEDVKSCPDFKEQYGKGSDQRVQIISKSTQRDIKATKVRYLLVALISFVYFMSASNPNIALFVIKIPKKWSKVAPNLNLAFSQKYSQLFFHVAVLGHD